MTKTQPRRSSTLPPEHGPRADVDAVAQIFNSAGDQVYRRYWQNEVMPAGKWVLMTALWNVTLIGGDDRMDVNVYDASWSLLSENQNTATLRVTSTLTLPPVVNGKDPAPTRPRSTR